MLSNPDQMKCRSGCIVTMLTAFDPDAHTTRSGQGFAGIFESMLEFLSSFRFVLSFDTCTPFGRTLLRMTNLLIERNNEVLMDLPFLFSKRNQFFKLSID